MQQDQMLSLLTILCLLASVWILFKHSRRNQYRRERFAVEVAAAATAVSKTDLSKQRILEALQANNVSVESMFTKPTNTPEERGAQYDAILQQLVHIGEKEVKAILDSQVPPEGKVKQLMAKMAILGQAEKNAMSAYGQPIRDIFKKYDVKDMQTIISVDLKSIPKEQASQISDQILKALMDIGPTTVNMIFEKHANDVPAALKEIREYVDKLIKFDVIQKVSDAAGAKKEQVAKGGNGANDKQSFMKVDKNSAQVNSKVNQYASDYAQKQNTSACFCAPTECMDWTTLEDGSKQCNLFRCAETHCAAPSTIPRGFVPAPVVASPVAAPTVAVAPGKIAGPVAYLTPPPPTITSTTEKFCMEGMCGL